jgi:hypothetical protein
LPSVPKPKPPPARERVLRYPDLASKLTEPPLNYERLDQWNGWLPPAFISGHDGEIPNDSPRQAALVDLAAEALRRHRA